MAKEKGEKTNLYLLSIVAIVAIVGIVVLILNSGTGSVSLSDSDLSGQAIAMKTSGRFIDMKGMAGEYSSAVSTGHSCPCGLCAKCTDYDNPNTCRGSECCECDVKEKKEEKEGADKEETEEADSDDTGDKTSDSSMTGEDCPIGIVC